MKKCPQCGHEYDLTMSICLDDGSELLCGPPKPISNFKEGLIYGIDLSRDGK